MCNPDVMLGLEFCLGGQQHTSLSWSSQADEFGDVIPTHRHFIASSSAIHVGQVPYERKEHAPNKTQSCHWSIRMPLGPFIGKIPLLRKWWLATCRTTSLCRSWQEADPSPAMCTPLGRARSWCGFLMFSLCVIELSSFDLVILTDTDEFLRRWSMSNVNITHLSVPGTNSNSQRWCCKVPKFGHTCQVLKITKEVRCSVVLVAWFLQCIHDAS